MWDADVSVEGCWNMQQAIENPKLQAHFVGWDCIDETAWCCLHAYKSRMIRQACI
jgi:hypothetical protein